MNGSPNSNDRHPHHHKHHSTTTCKVNGQYRKDNHRQRGNNQSQ